MAMKYPLDRESLERESTIEFFIAGGPGGQHRNKVESGVRLTHRPSGVVVSASERRSQAANREMAFDRLAERLQKLQHRRTPRLATRPTRANKEERLQFKRRIGINKQQRTHRVHGDD
jgi:protein subunit release factor B